MWKVSETHDQLRSSQQRRSIDVPQNGSESYFTPRRSFPTGASRAGFLATACTPRPRLRRGSQIESRPTLAANEISSGRTLMGQTKESLPTLKAVRMREMSKQENPFIDMLDIRDINTFLAKSKSLADSRSREWLLEQMLRKYDDRLRVFSMDFSDKEKR